MATKKEASANRFEPYTYNKVSVNPLIYEVLDNETGLDRQCAH